MKYADDKLEVFMSHRSALVDYATPITGCRSKAEDVVQDAFLRYVPTADGHEDPLRAGVSYLYRIVRNLSIDMVRRSAMESRYTDADTVTWLEPAGEAGPEEVSEYSDQVGRVAAVLEALPEKERLAVEMHRFGDYTLADIARRLEVSIATAHRMVRNAMLKVAKELD